MSPKSDILQELENSVSSNATINEIHSHYHSREILFPGQLIPLSLLFGREGRCTNPALGAPLLESLSGVK